MSNKNKYTRPEESPPVFSFVKTERKKKGRSNLINCCILVLILQSDFFASVLIHKAFIFYRINLSTFILFIRIKRL